MAVAYELYRGLKRGKIYTHYNTQEKARLLQIMEKSEKFILPKAQEVAVEPWLYDYQEYQLEDIRIPYPSVCVEYKTNMDEDGVSRTIDVVVVASVVPASKTEFYEDGIMFSTFFKLDGRWGQYPAAGFIPQLNMSSSFRQASYERISPVIMVLELHEAMQQVGRSNATKDLGMDVRALLSISAPRMGHKIEYPLAQTAAMRSAMSRERRMFAHRQLFVSPVADVKESRVARGTHASPAMHKRRGHFRQLKSGKVIWVQSSIVGKPENGVVTKDYVMEGSQK